MVNPVKGEAALVTADGRRFTLVLDMAGLIAAEGIYGKPIDELMADCKAGFLGAVAALVGGAFARHHPEVDRGTVLALLETDKPALFAALTSASAAAFPYASAEGKGGTPVPEAAPVGKRSGRSGAKRGSTPKRSGKRPRAASH